jgi:hypothetical protein
MENAPVPIAKMEEALMETRNSFHWEGMRLVWGDISVSKEIIFQNFLWFCNCFIINGNSSQTSASQPDDRLAEA